MGERAFPVLLAILVLATALHVAVPAARAGHECPRQEARDIATSLPYEWEFHPERFLHLPCIRQPSLDPDEPGGCDAVEECAPPLPPLPPIGPIDGPGGGPDLGRCDDWDFGSVFASTECGFTCDPKRRDVEDDDVIFVSASGTAALITGSAECANEEAAFCGFAISCYGYGWSPWVGETPGVCKGRNWGGSVLSVIYVQCASLECTEECPIERERSAAFDAIENAFPFVGAAYCLEQLPECFTILPWSTSILVERGRVLGWRCGQDICVPAAPTCARTDAYDECRL